MTSDSSLLTLSDNLNVTENFIKLYMKHIGPYRLALPIVLPSSIDKTDKHVTDQRLLSTFENLPILDGTDVLLDFL